MNYEAFCAIILIVFFIFLLYLSFLHDDNGRICNEAKAAGVADKILSCAQERK